MNAHARSALTEIVEDILDRRGLRQYWQSLDDEVSEQITSSWGEAIERAITAAVREAVDVEREACAKVARKAASYWDSEECATVARRIRARAAADKERG